MLIGLAFLVEGCSLLAAAILIGRGYTTIDVWTVPAYALPVGLHVLAAATAWSRHSALTQDRRRRDDRAFPVLVGVLVVLGVLSMPLYTGSWDVLAIIVAAVLCVTGPIVLDLVADAGDRTETTTESS